MKTLLDHIKEAHAKAGAPGRVTGFWGNGTYNAKLQHGSKKFRFLNHGVGDDRVTVICNWTIAGDRQRKQATSTKEST